MNKEKIFAYLISSFIMMFFYAAIWTCEFTLSERLLFNVLLIIGHLRLLIEISDINI